MPYFVAQYMPVRISVGSLYLLYGTAVLLIEHLASNRFTTRINIAIMCISMVAVTRSLPDYAAAQVSLGVSPGPVVTEIITRLPLYAKVATFFLYRVDVY